MKFKTIFLIFNVILSLTFLFIFFLPLFVLGIGPAVSFWGQWWYLGGGFLLLLGVMDYVYLSNAALYTFMESDDLPGLIQYLENLLLDKKKFSSLRVKLYLQASVRVGSVEKLKILSGVLNESAPKLAKKYAVNLSLPLFGDFKALRSYAQEWLNKVNASDKLWLSFLTAFAYLDEKDTGAAKEALLPCAIQNKNKILQLLALYYLMEAVVPIDPGLEARLLPHMGLLKKDKDATVWDKRISSASSEVLILIILSKVLATAKQWLGIRTPEEK